MEPQRFREKVEGESGQNLQKYFGLEFSDKLRPTPEVLSSCLCLYKTLPKEVCTNSEALVQELSAT